MLRSSPKTSQKNFDGCEYFRFYCFCLFALIHSLIQSCLRVSSYSTFRGGLVFTDPQMKRSPSNSKSWLSKIQNHGFSAFVSFLAPLFTSKSTRSAVIVLAIILTATLLYILRIFPSGFLSIFSLRK